MEREVLIVPNREPGKLHNVSESVHGRLAFNSAMFLTSGFRSYRSDVGHHRVVQRVQEDARQDTDHNQEPLQGVNNA